MNVAYSFIPQLSIDKVSYGGWQQCYRVSDGEIEMLVTADVGPRVLQFRFIGEENQFKEIGEEIGGSGEAEWRARGGHRLWLAPLDREGAPCPDNEAVQVVAGQDEITFIAPACVVFPVERRLTVRMVPGQREVLVGHTIVNRGEANVSAAPWAISMMAPGGTAIMAAPPRGLNPSPRRPSYPLVVWPYTDLRDSRWEFVGRYVLLRHDPENPAKTKLGVFAPHSWGAYLRRGTLFFKETRALPEEHYPDFGSSFEVFADGDTVELETLGPQRELRPGESLSHAERWRLARDVVLPEMSVAAIEEVLLTFVTPSCAGDRQEAG